MQSPSWRLGRTSSDNLASQLNVDADVVSGRITLVGELDRQTAYRLLDASRTMAATEHLQWVLDTHGLHFCDASGLRAISVTYRQAIRRGATLTVLGAGASLRRALTTIKLDQHVLPLDGPPLEVRALMVDYAAPTFPLARVYAL